MWRLVHKLGGEINPKFGGHDGETALAPLVARVELRNRRGTRLHLGGLAELSPCPRDPPRPLVLFEQGAVVRGVSDGVPFILEEIIRTVYKGPLQVCVGKA